MENERTDESADYALVQAVVKRFLGRGADSEDLFQSGYIGLLSAKRGFDSSRGVAFTSYAFPFIEGEIRRFLRNDRSIKLPRGAMRLSSLVKDIMDTSENGQERSERLEMLSRESGVSCEQLMAMMNATDIISISKLEEDYCGAFSDEAFHVRGFEAELVERMDLENLLKTLNTIEQRVIELRYFRNKTQQETGEIMSISQSQVSRYEKKALKKLRQNQYQ